MMKTSSTLVYISIILSICLVTLVKGQTYNKPNNTNLHLFTAYHTATIAPDQVLFKEFPTNVLLTYEVQCIGRPCDVVILKNKQDYFQWRKDYYNKIYMVSELTNFQQNYNATVDYRTTEPIVLAFANPVKSPGSVEIWYNYKYRDIPGTLSGALIGAIVGSILGGCCLLCIGIGLLVWCCLLKRTPKEYFPVQEVPREF
ncbi:hypothetical protein ABK040_015514 [Willaertia magna]